MILALLNVDGFPDNKSQLSAVQTVLNKSCSRMESFEAINGLLPRYRSKPFNSGWKARCVIFTQEKYK